MSEHSGIRRDKGIDRRAHDASLGIDHKRRQREINRINKQLHPSPTPIITKIAGRIALAGLATATSAGIIDVAAGDPAGIIGSGRDVAADTTSSIGQTGADTITNYPSAEVQAYNASVDRRLDGTDPLKPGEQFFVGVKIVAAANNFEDLQKMKANKTRVAVYAVPWSELGLNEPIGWADQGEPFAGKVISVPNLIRPDSMRQNESYKYGGLSVIYDSEEGGNKLPAQRVWIPGPNGAVSSPEDLNPKQDSTVY